MSLLTTRYHSSFQTKAKVLRRLSLDKVVWRRTIYCRKDLWSDAFCVLIARQFMDVGVVGWKDQLATKLH
jgi:hypothetical protein